MKLLITGCNGRMGKMLVECSQFFDIIEVSAGVDINIGEKNIYDFPVFKSIDNITFPVDVVLDFSHPSSTDAFLAYALKYNVPIVIATTGHSPDQIKNIKEISKKIPVFFSANMSIGINLVNELLKKAVKVLFEDFDVEIVEKHHNKKIDAPSGTALLLANTIKEQADSELTYVYDRQSVRRKREHQEVGIHSVRGGTIIGDHDVIFAGEDEVITISHSAQSRKVFAMGALRAAIFIAGKKNGLFNMDDLIAEKIN